MSSLNYSEQTAHRDVWLGWNQAFAYLCWVFSKGFSHLILVTWLQHQTGRLHLVCWN